MVDDEEYQLFVDDEFAAGTSGAGAYDEIMNYALQYVNDGRVDIYKVTRQLVVSYGDHNILFIDDYSVGM